MCEIVVGATPSTSEAKYWINGTIFWLPSGCCKNDCVTENYPSIKKITQLGYDSCSTKMMKKDSTLIALTGATVGKVGYLTFEACGNQSLVGIYPYSNIDPKFLYYYMMGCYEDILADCVGSAQPHISKEYINGMLFPLPPLKEQKRIVEKLDTIFSELDSISKSQTILDNLYHKLKNKILELAFMGRLTEQLAEEGSGNDLFECIQKEKKSLIGSGKLRNKKPSKSIDVRDIPFKIPTSWKWTRLSDIAQINPKNDLDDELEVGFIPMNLVGSGLTNNHSYEIRKWGQIKKGFTHFRNGDIAVAKITPCFENKKSCIIKKLPNGVGAGTTELYIIRGFKDYLCPEYVLWYFKTERFIKEGVLSFNSVVGQQRVDKNYIPDLLFPLPPVKEQIRIAKKIEKLMTICDSAF